MLSRLADPLGPVKGQRLPDRPHYFLDLAHRIVERDQYAGVCRDDIKDARNC
jgi:hypothetical protein